MQLSASTSFIKFHMTVPCREVGWDGRKRENKGQDSKAPIIWAGQPEARPRFLQAVSPGNLDLLLGDNNGDGEKGRKDKLLKDKRGHKTFLT